MDAFGVLDEVLDDYENFVKGFLEIRDDQIRGITIARAVEDWCKTQGLKPPGKVAVASALVQDLGELRPEQSLIEELRAIHQSLIRNLG